MALPTLEPVTLWLLVGIVLLGMEMLFPVGVMLFAGLAAFLLSVLLVIRAFPFDDWGLMIAAWLALTVIVAACLWKPLQRWRGAKKIPPFQNMVGSAVTAITEVTVTTQGNVAWSGTHMRARLSPALAADTRLSAGHLARIVAVEGNVLILEPDASAAPK
jgi:membrane protein implicated in regulation of membrane protease activity